MIPVVLACCSRDQDQALRLLNWCAELGMHQSKLYLLCARNCAVDQLMAAARKGFSEVQYLPDVQEVDSNWHEKGNHYKSAAGPNSLFNQAAWNFYGPNATEWLFLEPDAIPCHPNWLRDISEEYELCKRSGKLFLGYEVTRNTHPGDVGHHMSGVAVYPPNVPNLAHRAVAAGDTAFDIEGAEQIVPQMMPSKLIFHRYRPDGFTTQEDFEERVPRQYAIYHACKDGSIIPFLRARLGLSAPHAPVVQMEEQRPSKTQVAGSTPAGSAAIDLFIKTRQHDYPWLEWCLKSVEKFAPKTFGSIQVLTESNESRYAGGHAFFHSDYVTSHTEGVEPGYLWQQRCKLYADKYIDADFILYMDSDCVFTRPVTPEDFIKDGKPIWLYTPLDQARPDQHHWIGVMEKFLGKRPEHEFMRRHPFIVERWMLEAVRTFCKYRHGKELEDYIMGEADPNNGLALQFSEWNCLGFFLWEYHRERVSWVLDSEAGPACCYQGFTHGGEKRKQEDLAKFKEILGEPESITQRPLGGGTAESRLTLESCIEYLAQEAAKDGFAKARILRQLRAAWKDVKAPITGKPRGRKKPEPITQNKGFLLCIHSYPGANDTVERHWPYFKKSGATRIVGIGTTDGKCTWPEEIDGVTEIGENKYIKGDHLCRRLLDTVKWCMTQPEDHFMIAEYDVVFLKKIPLPHGVCAHLTGGRVNGSKTHQFFHGPWCFDRASGPALIAALEAVLPECQGPPDNSPDLFFGLACERAQIKVGCGFRMFTRNSLDQPGDLDLAVQAARDGVHCIHGVKHDYELQAIKEVLNERHLELSHAQ